MREEHAAEHRLKYKQTGKELRVQFQPTFIGNTVESVVAFACAGMGIALRPDLAVVNQRDQGVLIEAFAD